MDIQLANVGKLLKDRKLKLEITPAAKDVIISEGYDPQYGARPMRRAIQRLIQDPLALKLINGDFAKAIPSWWTSRRSGCATPAVRTAGAGSRTCRSARQ